MNIYFQNNRSQSAMAFLRSFGVAVFFLATAARGADSPNILYIMSDGTPEQNLKQIFRVFDINNDGKITLKVRMLPRLNIC